MLWLRRPPQMGPDQFGGCYLEEHVPRLLERSGVCRCVANLVDVPQASLIAAGLRQGDLEAGAVDEVWCESPQDLSRLLEATYSWVQVLACYRVGEQVHRDYDRSWDPGRRTPGVKVIFSMRRSKALTHAQFTAHWRSSHVPKALKHHVGMWRYATNPVAESLVPEAPEVDGFSLLNFRTHGDLVERFYDSPEGESVILADVRQFLSARTIGGYQVSEYVQQ